MKPTMNPTREDVLLAWMTLVKIRESYAITYGKPIDAADDQFLLAALKLLDKYQHKMMIKQENAVRHRG